MAPDSCSSTISSLILGSSSLSSTARVALMMPAPTSTISTASLSCCVINAFSRITALNCRDRSTRPRKTHQPDGQERSMCLDRCSGTCAREQEARGCLPAVGRAAFGLLPLAAIHPERAWPSARRWTLRGKRLRIMLPKPAAAFAAGSRLCRCVRYETAALSSAAHGLDQFDIRSGLTLVGDQIDKALPFAVPGNEVVAGGHEEAEKADRKSVG